ncbi:MAG: hypothetical protein PF961_03985 [Planctomycetota bacterium]|nr:hypothetical protein [Planctomycetota bacterium]
MDQHQASCRGAWMPIHVPLGWLDTETRAEWLVTSEGVPLPMRVRAALEAKRENDAWHLLRGLGGSAMSNMHLSATLGMWAARRQAQLRLPATGEPVIMPAEGRERRHEHLAVAALRDAQSMFSSLLWPRWAGPAVLVSGDQAFGALASDEAMLPRPALPLVRIPADIPEGSLREEMAARWCALILAIEAGDATWPAWLVRGMDGVARAKARGEGPSPRAMQAKRSAAGSDGLRRCLLTAEPDPELATAICAYLVHSRRVSHLPALLEALRNGADSLTALEIAYAATLNKLQQRH